MNPFAGRHWTDLTADEMKQRQRWMTDEANRLVEERSKVQRPARPFVANFPKPAAFDAEGARRREVTSVAARLADALAVRDRGVS